MTNQIFCIVAQKYYWSSCDLSLTPPWLCSLTSYSAGAAEIEIAAPRLLKSLDKHQLHMNIFWLKRGLYVAHSVLSRHFCTWGIFPTRITKSERIQTKMKVMRTFTASVYWFFSKSSDPHLSRQKFDKNDFDNSQPIWIFAYHQLYSQTKMDAKFIYWWPWYLKCT